MYKNKSCIDFNKYFKTLNIHENPIACFSTLLIMYDLSKPSKYLQFIEEQDLYKTFNENNDFMNNFFKQPFLLEDIKTKPQLIRLGIETDSYYKNIIFSFSYVTNSRNVKKEVEDLKNYLKKTYPKMDEFYDIIEFRIFNRIPQTKDEKFKTIRMKI